jgi:hypothetical protein
VPSERDFSARCDGHPDSHDGFCGDNLLSLCAGAPVARAKEKWMNAVLEPILVDMVTLNVCVYLIRVLLAPRKENIILPCLCPTVGGKC